MLETKTSDWVTALVLTQVSVLTLKLTNIGAAGRLSWTTVFMPTWIPLALAGLVIAFYVVSRRLLPEKKKQVNYTSTRWQERLAETHSTR